MAVDLTVERAINASPETIWGHLTDSAAFAKWNRSVVSLGGTIALGERIELVSVVDPKRTFKLTVAEMEPARRMVWTDGMPLGLFTGRRTYTLEPQGGGTTTFTMNEKFSGPLAGLISRFVPDMTDSFDLFADSLKEVAEGHPAA